MIVTAESVVQFVGPSALTGVDKLGALYARAPPAPQWTLAAETEPVGPTL